MGNAQAAGPKLDFSKPYLGNTVTTKGAPPSSTGIIIQYDGPEVKEGEEEVEVDEDSIGIRVQVTSADGIDSVLETTLSGVSLASTPREPYCCSEEEACAGWLWKRLPALIDERNDAKEDGEDTADTKRIMKEECKNESIMLGFLTVETQSKRANAAWDKLNLETVANKIVDSLFWRYGLNAHTILDAPQEKELGLKIPGALHGVGLEGRPVLWTIPCWFQWTEIDGDEIERVELRNQEEMNVCLDRIQENGKKYRDMIVIVNLDGMGAWVVKYLGKFKRHATVSEEHYPGRAWKTLCINSSSVISRGYSTFVRPFLSTHTQNLVVMCAKGQETTDALRKYISPEFIPRCFGGEAPGNGHDDILLEEKLFPDGVNATAAKFRDDFLAKKAKN